MSAEDLTKKIINSKFSVLGMTCQSCVSTITNTLSLISGINSVDVSLADKKVDLVSNRNISIHEVRTALRDLPKYSVEDYKPKLSHSSVDEKESESVLKTYKPLITIFMFIILVSLSYQLSLDFFNKEIFMNHLMAGFFIGLSFFKFLDLNAFSESFSSYDPIAQRWLGYGKIYPFIELMLGLLFISGKFLLLANITTILVLSLTTYGVYLRLQSKSKFQCACLGTTFSLPLSNVTIAENIVMIVMAIYNIATI